MRPSSAASASGRGRSGEPCTSSIRATSDGCGASRRAGSSGRPPVCTAASASTTTCSPAPSPLCGRCSAATTGSPVASSARCSRTPASTRPACARTSFSSHCASGGSSCSAPSFRARVHRAASSTSSRRTSGSRMPRRRPMRSRRSSSATCAGTDRPGSPTSAGGSGFRSGSRARRSRVRERAPDVVALPAFGPGPNGAVAPVLVTGGRVVGTWKHALAVDRYHLAPVVGTVEVQLDEASVAAALARSVEFLAGGRPPQASARSPGPDRPGLSCAQFSLPARRQAGRDGHPTGPDCPQASNSPAPTYEPAAAPGGTAQTPEPMWRMYSARRSVARAF